MMTTADDTKGHLTSLNQHKRDGSAGSDGEIKTAVIDVVEGVDSAGTAAGEDEGNDEEISDLQLKLNIAKMTVMWTVISFSTWLLTFMNKNLEGSIYTNNYMESAAGGIASIIGGTIYGKLGLKTFRLAFVCALAGGFLIFLVEEELLIYPHWYLNTFEGSLKQQKMHAADALVPRFAFVSKLGVYLSMICVYQASFNSDTIFPPAQRASAIGFCQLFARSITCLSPEVNEFSPPYPMIIFLALNIISLAVCFTFENEDEKKQLDQVLKASKEKK